MSREEEKLIQLINNAPKAASGNGADAAALAAAEQAAQNADYGSTADGRLDRAINEYLHRSGYSYNTADDAGYQDFAREHSNNALSGRAAAESTAERLSGGWTPTYTQAAGSAVQGDIAANAANYAPSFRSLARQEQAAKTAQAGTSAQILGAMADTEYARNRDTQGDRMNYLSYLAGKYADERQAQAQKAGFESDVYRTNLSAAASNAADVRSLNNRLYQFGTQSAQNRAQLEADQAEFEQKQAYTAAYDAYKERVAAEQAAAKEAASLEKNKTKYFKTAGKIQEVISGRALKGDERYDLDLNRDGSVNNQDLVIASRAAESGEFDPNYISVGNDIASDRAVMNTINYMKRLKGYNVNSAEDKKRMENDTIDIASQYGLDLNKEKNKAVFIGTVLGYM